jgi:hypothetical protein
MQRRWQISALKSIAESINSTLHHANARTREPKAAVPHEAVISWSANSERRAITVSLILTHVTISIWRDIVR